MKARTYAPRSLACCLLLLVSAGRLRAQATAEALADALQSQTAKQNFILHNFSALPEVHAELRAGAVTFAPTTRKSFSLVRFDHVWGKGQTVRLSGTKSYLVHSGNGQLAHFDEQEPITLVLDIAPGSAVPAAADVLSQLFFRRLSEAVASLPAGLSGSVPEASDTSRAAGKSSSQKPAPPAGCDCRDATPGCPDGGAQHGMTPPVLVQQADAYVPRESPPHGGNLTRVAARIRVDGTLGETWMLHATSASAADATFTALQDYHFRPAACHGTPVETTLLMDQHF